MLHLESVLFHISSLSEIWFNARPPKADMSETTPKADMLKSPPKADMLETPPKADMLENFFIWSFRASFLLKAFQEQVHDTYSCV